MGLSPELAEREDLLDKRGIGQSDPARELPTVEERVQDQQRLQYSHFAAIWERLPYVSRGTIRKVAAHVVTSVPQMRDNPGLDRGGAGTATALSTALRAWICRDMSERCHRCQRSPTGKGAVRWRQSSERGGAAACRPRYAQDVA